MAALTADRNTLRKATDENTTYPVAASTTLYAGSLVCINTSGYAVAAADTAGLRLVGVAKAQADNSSGSAGDVNIEVYHVGAFECTSSGLTIANEGDPVWVSDDQTVTTTPGNVFAGVLRDYVSATSAFVDIEPAVRQETRGLRTAKVFAGNINTANHSGGVTVTGAVGDPEVQFITLNANYGNDLTWRLPAEASSKGLAFEFYFTCVTTDSLLVKEDAGSSTIVTLLADEGGRVVCDGTSWKGLVGANT